MGHRLGLLFLSQAPCTRFAIGLHGLPRGGFLNLIQAAGFPRNSVSSPQAPALFVPLHFKRVRVEERLAAFLRIDLVDDLDQCEAHGPRKP